MNTKQRSSEGTGGRGARRAMRLALVFSGFLALAVAATSDAPRGTLLSALTGRVDDAAAADRDDDEFADAGRRAMASMVSEYRDASSRA